MINSIKEFYVPSSLLLFQQVNSFLFCTKRFLYIIVHTHMAQYRFNYIHFNHIIYRTHIHPYSHTKPCTRHILNKHKFLHFQFIFVILKVYVIYAYMVASTFSLIPSSMQRTKHEHESVPTFKPNSADFSILQAYPNLPIFVQAFLPSSCEVRTFTYFAFCFSLTQSSNMDSHAFGMSSSNVNNVYLLLLNEIESFP